MGESPGGSRPDVIRPPEDACCATCGGVVGDEWVSYRPDPDNREALLQDFSQVIDGKLAGARVVPHSRGRSRDFRERREMTALVLFATGRSRGLLPSHVCAKTQAD